jgi:hypothetical protein
MYELINTMIKAHEKDAVRSKAKPKNAQSLRRAITELAVQENAKVPVERRVTQRDIEVVASRSLNNTAGLERPSRFFAAYREVASFIALATTGATPTRVTPNRDLLVIGHPLSTRTHAMTASAYSEAVARWIAADPRIADEVRPLVAAVYMTNIGSVDYEHAVARLTALPSGMVPQEFIIDSQLEPITASFRSWLGRIFGGGNSSTARSLRAKAQLRDREGQFAEQGGGMQFYVRMADGTYKSKVGSHAGNSGNGTDFLVEISGDSDIEDGIISVPASMTKAIEAIIPGDDAGAVSLPEGVEAVDLANIERKDVPDGWKLAREKGEGETGPDKVYATEDGYEVEYWAPGNFGNPELQKVHVFNKGLMNEVPGQVVGNFTPSVDATGRRGPSSKFTKDKPFLALFRVETPETKRQAVVAAQNWSDVQQAAELDQDKFEKYYDAAEKVNAEKKVKQADADAKSKAADEAFEKKAAEVAKQNEQTRQEIQSNLAQGIDPFGNKIPAGWTAIQNDYELNPRWTSKKGDKEYVTTLIDKAKTVAFEREEQGFKARLFHTEDGGLQGIFQNQKFADWDAAEQGFAETVEADVNARRDAALDAVESYDESGDLRSMIENAATGEEVLSKLRENKAWNEQEDDYNTRGFVDLPQAQQKARWKEFEKKLNAITNMPKEFDGVETPSSSKIGLAKTAGQIKVGDKIINSDGLEGTVTTVKDSGTRVRISTDTDKNENGKFYEENDVIKFAPVAGEDVKAELPEPTTKKAGDLKVGDVIIDSNGNPQKIEKISSVDSGDMIAWRDSVTKKMKNKIFENPDQDVQLAPETKEPDFSNRLQELKALPEDVKPSEFFNTLVKDAKSWSKDDFVKARGDEADWFAVPDDARIYMTNTADGVIAKHADGSWHFHDAEGNTTDLDSDEGEETAANLKNDILNASDALLFYDGGMIDQDLQLSLFDEAPGEEPTTPAATPEPTSTPAPAAEKKSDDIQWILPDGAYSLWKADEYEPQGRIDEESPDFTDDPKVLANKFSTEQLKDALAQAIIGVKDFATEFLDELKDLDDEDEEEGAKKKTGPKKKKPKSKDATGFGQLDFSFGDENVPAEAIYSAIKEQGEDADLIAAELYDLPLGESKNVDMLEGLRSPEEVKAQEPSVLLDDFDKDAMDIVELNEEITKQDPAAAAVAQINEAQAGGEDNVFIRDVAVDINSLKSPTDLSSFLGKYIGWAISGSGDEKQAFRALWGVLLSTDGGYTKQGIDDSMLFNAVSNSMQSYNGTEPSIEEVEVIFNEFGYYEGLVKSKARVANGEETLDMPESPAGAMYRLLAAMAGPNTTSLYRGIQIPLDPDNLSVYEEGQTLSLDPRSFSDDKALAGKFAGAFGGNEDKAAVIFTIPAGKGNVAKVDNISMFEDEREQLAWGNYRVKSVSTKVNPAGKTLINVELEALDKRGEALEGFTDDYESLLIENNEVTLPQAYYTPAVEPYENPDVDAAADEAEVAAIEASNPLYIARAYEMEDLIAAFRGSVEDGTGKIQLLDEDEEYTVDVEAVRDALQIQGINTNAVLEDIANTEPDVEAEDADIEPLEPIAESLLDEIIQEFGQEYDLEGFEQTGPQQGSNQGGTFKDADGNEYYVKSPKSDQHRRNELLASAFYKLAGVDAAEMRFGSADDGNEKIFSAIIPGNTLGDTDLTPETKKQIQEGFAIDAWLANWDVAGLVNDNIIIDEDGNAFRIDTGGALLFRAMGAPKGSAFANEVTELDTLRNSGMNPTSAELFGDMTDEDLKASASKLLDISHTDIDNLVDATFDGDVADELKDKLKARRQFILEKYNLLGDDTSLIAETTKVEEPAPSAAVDETEAQLDTLLSWATEYQGSTYGTSDADAKKFEAIETQVETILVDYRNGEITEADLPKALDELTEFINSYNWEGDQQTLNNVEDLTDQISAIKTSLATPEVETPEPEQPTPPTPEVPSEAPGNPYVTSDGVPIEIGMQVRHKKTGEVGTVIKYDKGNASYVFVQGEDNSIKNKSTKQLESVSGGGGGQEVTPEPEPTPEPEAPAPESPETPEEPATPEPEVAPEPEQTPDSEIDLANYTKMDIRVDKLGAGDLLPQYFPVKNAEENLLKKRAEDPNFELPPTDEIIGAYKAVMPNKRGLKVRNIKTGKERFFEVNKNAMIYDVRRAKAKKPTPEPEALEPTTPEVTQAPTEPKVIDTTASVETAVKDIQSAIDNNQLISFYYNGKIRTMKPMSIWENQKNGKINVYGEDLGDDSKKKNFTVQQMQEIPDGSKPEAVTAEEPVAEPKKLQLHAQWIKDLMAQKGVSISDEKAVEIRDVIEKNDLIEKWSSAVDSEIIEAIDEALGPDWNEAVGNTDWENDDVEQEDTPASGLQRQNIIQYITDLAGTPGFQQEKYVNAVSNPNLTSDEADELLDEITQIGIELGGVQKITPPVGEEGDDPDEVEAEPFGDEAALNKAADLVVKTFENGFTEQGKIIAVNESDGTIAITPDGEVVYIFDGKKNTSFTSPADPAFFGPDGDGGKVFQWRPLSNEENDALLKKIADNAVPFGTPKNEGPSEGDEPNLDETATEAPTLEPGAEVTDKKGNKGTVLKGPNKDNYVFVQFEDGKTGWRSAGSVSTTGEFNESIKKAAPKATAGKMTPAGTKAVFVESPAGWDTSGFENVPALSDAIALVQNPDDKFAAMRGASAAIDADSIEDLDVRIMRVRDIEGNDGLRLKFKLTSWAGNARVKQIMEMTQEQRDAEGIKKGQMVVDRIDVGSDGVGQISKDKNSYQGDGVTWTITTPEGIVIKIYRGNYDATSKLSSSKYGQPRAFHNMVQIQAPADVTNEQIADALKKAGVSDVRPATPADSRILVENRLMSIFDGKVDATKNPKGTEREESLQRIKDKYGITPDDVVITTGASGRIETRLSPEGAQKIVDATGSPTAIQHNITVPGFFGSATPEENFEQRTDWIAKLIGTPQGGLLSTTTRWTEGIGASGMSSSADVGTGGADYVFTKPVKVADAKTYGTSGVLMYFDPVKLYQRLDFYANLGDNFGKRQPNQNVIGAAKVGAYELMFKHRLSFDDLDSIVVSNQATRTAVIQKLRQMGIDQIGGRPLEAVIIIGSNVNPNA